MDKKTFTIGILFISAVILFVANLLVPPHYVNAAEVIKDRDYQAVTARIQQGDEGLYVLDNRSGQMAIFVYNPQLRALQVKDVKPVTNAFAKSSR